MLGCPPRKPSRRSRQPAANPTKTVWVTDEWFEPRRRLLLERLTNPVTEAEVEALTDSLLKRAPLDAVLVWLSVKPRPVWGQFHPRWEQQEQKRWDQQWAKNQSQLPQRRQYDNVKLDIWSPTPEVDVALHLFCRQKAPTERDVLYLGKWIGPAEGCPGCRTPVDALDWRFVELISPRDGAREGEGWIALCHDCRLVVHSLLPRGGDFDARWETPVPRESLDR